MKVSILLECSGQKCRIHSVYSKEERLKNEGSETVTVCHQLKMLAEDGKLLIKKFKLVSTI